MTAYRIKYQTRRKDKLTIPSGNWQYKEKTVLAGDDAREAIDKIVDSLQGYSCRLRGVKVVGRVDMIAKTNSTDREC